MRATEPPRRCKCDECTDRYRILHEFNLFSARNFGDEEKDPMTILH